MRPIQVRLVEAPGPYIPDVIPFEFVDPATGLAHRGKAFRTDVAWAETFGPAWDLERFEEMQRAVQTYEKRVREHHGAFANAVWHQIKAGLRHLAVRWDLEDARAGA